MRIVLAVVVSLASLAWLGGSAALADEPSETAYFAALVKRADCDHACLTGLMDRYLEALAAHDPSRLPLAKQVRFTENTNEMALGDGAWQTVDRVLPQRVLIADPATGQVVCYVAVVENGHVSLLNVRLKELAGQITEIEQAVVRSLYGNFGSYSELAGPLGVWNEVLPKSQRRSRQELIALVNQYFEGIEQSNGDIVPFDVNCVRWENNRQTAPSPQESAATQSAPPNSAMAVMRGLTTQQQFNTHLFSYIVHITDRRFPVVDEERGIVYATVMFQHPGSVRFVDVPGHGRVELTGATSAFPNTTEILEAFRVKNGKIANIYAYVSILPYHQRPGW